MSFDTLEALFREKQNNGPQYLFDINRESENAQEWAICESDERRIRMWAFVINEQHRRA